MLEIRDIGADKAPKLSTIDKNYIYRHSSSNAILPYRGIPFNAGFFHAKIRVKTLSNAVFSEVDKKSYKKKYFLVKKISKSFFFLQMYVIHFLLNK